MTKDIIDYTDEYCKGGQDNAIKVHGRGNNVLFIRKLDTPYTRFDGKKAIYEIEWRWLSCDCKHDRDEAWACCNGTEFTYWQTRELGRSLKDGVSLFDCFNLF